MRMLLLTFWQKNHNQVLLTLFLITLTNFVLVETSHAAVDEDSAAVVVKNSPCMTGRTIEDALKDKIKIRSQRDLGWEVFNENGEFEVERAFLMNKSMQLRFRWHVKLDGTITPVSSRAETLCIEE